MTAAIDDAKAKGARVVNEGGGVFCQTLFYPAVVYPVQEGMKLYREEQFGPIIPVMPFDDVETALQYVITSDHGQQVSIFGTDPAQIGALVDPLVNQVCRVNLNCQCQRGPDVFPFAGRKDSAEGTLSVTDALRSFSIRSMVAAKQTDDKQGAARRDGHGPQVEVRQYGVHFLAAGLMAAVGGGFGGCAGCSEWPATCFYCGQMILAPDRNPEVGGDKCTTMPAVMLPCRVRPPCG